MERKTKTEGADVTKMAFTNNSFVMLVEVLL
jgi:hypothetical protein